MSQQQGSPRGVHIQHGVHTPTAGVSCDTRDEADGSSPTRRARVQEKLELAQLNDRLKHYIDEVRQTKRYNSELLVVVGDAKKELVVEAQRYESRIAEFEAKLITTEQRAVSSDAQYRAVRTENSKLRQQVIDLEQKIQELQSQFENVYANFEFERQNKVELHGRVEVLKKDLESIRQTHIQELVEMRRLISDGSFSTPGGPIETIDVKKLRGEIEVVIADYKQQIITAYEKMSQQDEELYKLKADYTALMKEHHQVVGDKVPLNSEITYYRELLEVEEERLHLSPPANKKPRLDDSSTLPQQQFSLNSSYSGCFEISEVDYHGRYIKIKNTSSKTESLAGYSITNEADGSQELVFHFHSRSKLMGGVDVTVWGRRAEGAKHTPPTNVIWKAQESWRFGNTSITKLLNRDKEVVANYTTKKENTPSKKRTISQRTRLFHCSDHDKQNVQEETPTPAERSGCFLS